MITGETTLCVLRHGNTYATILKTTEDTYDVYRGNDLMYEEVTYTEACEFYKAFMSTKSLNHSEEIICITKKQPILS